MFFEEALSRGAFKAELSRRGFQGGALKKRLSSALYTTHQQ
jgi:hypothetical protein